MSETKSLKLYVTVDYELNGADIEQLASLLHIAAFRLPVKDMVTNTDAKVKTMKIGVAGGKIKAAEDAEKQAIAVLGNFAEGFKFVGPFPDFDLAAEAYDGMDSWIATLLPPEAPQNYAVCDAAVEAYIDGVLAGATCEDELIDSLDNLVHDLVSGIASNVNNEGPEAQLRYIIKDLGLAEAKKQIDSLLKNLSHD